MAQIDEGVRITIKRLLGDVILNVGPRTVKRKRGDHVVERVDVHQIVRHTTDKHSAEMSFRLSDEGAEALCVLLNAPAETRRDSGVVLQPVVGNSEPEEF